MDEDLTFPNPVLRTDLPAKRRWWPRLLAATLVLLLLGTIFLPQVLHTRIGRRLLRARLESKYNAEISIGDLTTHWGGGTVVSQFWMKGIDGRVVGFNRFSGDVSLWQLLRGNYALGNCAIDGLVVDYVLDSGDSLHRDTYEQFTGATPMAKGATPPLAKLSGRISLTNSQLNLARGMTDATTLSTRFQTVHFGNMSGEFDIPALDQAWTYKVTGDIGLTAEDRGQTFSSSGTICLGAGGNFVPSAIKVDAVATAEYAPTDLLPILAPILTIEDCHRSFGATFDRLNIAVKGDGGALRFEHLEAGGANTQFHLQPTIDLKTTPATLTMLGDDNVLTAAVPAAGGLKRALQCLNPMLLEAKGEGTIVLRITDLNVPVSKNWILGSGAGVLELHDVKLASARDPMLSDEPRSLLTQLCLLSGDANLTPALEAPPEKFTLDGGLITVDSARLKAGDATYVLTGTCSAEGALRMKVAVSSPRLAAAIPDLAGRPGQSLQVALTNTVDDPKVDVQTLRRSLPVAPLEQLDDWMKQQLAVVRAREAEIFRRDQERKVKDILKDFSATAPDKKP